MEILFLLLSIKISVTFLIHLNTDIMWPSLGPRVLQVNFLSTTEGLW